MDSYWCQKGGPSEITHSHLDPGDECLLPWSALQNQLARGTSLGSQCGLLAAGNSTRRACPSPPGRQTKSSRSPTALVARQALRDSTLSQATGQLSLSSPTTLKKSPGEMKSDEVKHLSSEKYRGRKTPKDTATPQLRLRQGLTEGDDAANSCPSSPSSPTFTGRRSEVPRGRAEIGEETHVPSLAHMTSTGACLASG
ncbi:hypothetical protein P7K49_006987 [Saguinus oedipus]|uniref:Uncharacterized protein n=1 Tax=Saguinus oedipus TaxID=9490 RepID=A0ABQ9W4U7_SAGOE|nr:hypothetical protein P7K49_006987 [Saguinus oedipus]